jgi:hypothetical protein
MLSMETLPCDARGPGSIHSPCSEPGREQTTFDGLILGPSERCQWPKHSVNLDSEWSDEKGLSTPAGCPSETSRDEESSTHQGSFPESPGRLAKERRREQQGLRKDRKGNVTREG